jgi:hypothetical protein
VRPRRALGDAQLIGDRPVGQAPRYTAQDIALARGQGPEVICLGAAGPARRPAAHPARHDARDRRIQVDLARGGGADRGGELVSFGVLQQEPGGAGLEGGHDACLLDEARDRHDLHVGVIGLDARGRVDAVDARHQQVHDHDVGLQRGRGLDRGVAVGGLTDDLEIVVQGEEIAHAPPNHRVIVDEQDADPG